MTDPRHVKMPSTGVLDAVRNGKPLRIALVTSSFAPHLGGVEEMVRQHAHELRRQGHHVLIITNRWPKVLPSSETIDGLEIRRWTFRCFGGGLRQRAAAATLGSVALLRMCGVMRKFRADLVHVHCLSSNAVYAHRASRILALPFVITTHGEFTMDANRVYDNPDVLAGAKPILKAASCVTACSSATLQEARELFPGLLEGPRGTVIPNGVKSEDFATSAAVSPPLYSRRYILCLGRLVPQKGFDIAIRALARLVAAGNDTHDIVIAGEGSELERLQVLAKCEDVGARVIFFGRADRRQTSALLKHAELLLVPSRLEPFGIVNLEGMAAGLPVVASRVGGIPEVVTSGVHGILVKPESVDDFAAAIDQILSDASLRPLMGAAGRAHAANFSWAAITARYVAVYRATLAKLPFS